METTSVIRVNSSMAENIRIYSEIENQTMVDFADDLLLEAFQNYLMRRSGGATLLLSNPRFSKNFNEDKAIGFVRLLIEVADKIRKYDSGIDFPIDKILTFYEYRLLIDSKEVIEKVEKNKKMDEGADLL